MTCTDWLHEVAVMSTTYNRVRHRHMGKPYAIVDNIHQGSIGNEADNNCDLI